MAAKKNDSNTLIFYRSFYDMLQEVEDPVARSAAYDAICAYAFFGRKPKTSNTFVKMVFHAAQPLIDANDKRRANGKKAAEKQKQSCRLLAERRQNLQQKNPVVQKKMQKLQHRITGKASLRQGWPC